MHSKCAHSLFLKYQCNSMCLCTIKPAWCAMPAPQPHALAGFLTTELHDEFPIHRSSANKPLRALALAGLLRDAINQIGHRAVCMMRTGDGYSSQLSISAGQLMLLMWWLLLFDMVMHDVATAFCQGPAPHKLVSIWHVMLTANALKGKLLNLQQAAVSATDYQLCAKSLHCYVLGCVCL